MDPTELTSLQPDRFFDGGDMDCGSGLILLLRQNLLETPAGGILEMRSSEPTVTDELPPWCRMVGHDYLGTLADGQRRWRHFLRRKADESAALAADKEQARAYEWRVRLRPAGNRSSTVYCRNFSWTLGQPASFDEADDHPSALEHAVAALAGDALAGYATRCRQLGLAIDDLECSAKARLHDVLAHLGLAEGDPGLASVELTLFITSPAKGDALRAAWAEARARSPLLQTLCKACEIRDRLVIL
jgi:hypothetical protein